MKALVWAVVGVIALILLGSFVVSALGVLFKLALYLLVGAAVVIGARHVIGRMRRAVNGPGRRSIR